MPFPIAEVIGAAATIGTTAANAGFTAKSNRKTRRFNEAMWERQRDLDKQNWDTQNEYNLPKNQMARLKEAGLNPALVYSQGATTLAQRIDAPTAPNYKDEPIQLPDNALKDVLGNIQSMKVNPLQNSILQQNLQNEQKRQHLIEAQTLDTLASADQKTQGISSGAIDLAIKESLHSQGLLEAQKRTEFDIQNMEAAKRAQEIQEQKNFQQLSKDKQLKEIQLLEQQIANAKFDGDVKKLHAELANQGINPNAGAVQDYWQQLRKFFNIFK